MSLTDPYDRLDNLLSKIASRGRIKTSEWPRGLSITPLDLGLEIDSDAGSLSFPDPVLELDIPFITGAIAKLEQSLNLKYSRIVSSTNKLLVDAYSEGHNTNCLYLCEFQVKGKGRRGKVWRSPYANAIMFSLGLEYPDIQKAAKGLSCALGLSVAKTLIGLGVADVSVKWPNDIYLGGRKVCGILIELVPIRGNSSAVVIGIGLNYRLTYSVLDMIDQPATDLSSHGIQQSRSQIITRLVEKLLADFSRFKESGFSSFKNYFNEIHWLENKLIEVGREGETIISGRVMGVNIEGELVLNSEGRKVTVGSGEISLLDKL